LLLSVALLPLNGRVLTVSAVAGGQILPLLGTALGLTDLRDIRHPAAGGANVMGHIDKLVFCIGYLVFKCIDILDIRIPSFDSRKP